MKNCAGLNAEQRTPLWETAPTDPNVGSETGRVKLPVALAPSTLGPAWRPGAGTDMRGTGPEPQRAPV